MGVDELGVPVQRENDWQFTLRFTPTALQDLRNNFGGQHIVSDILADVTGTSKSAVEKEGFIEEKKT